MHIYKKFEKKSISSLRILVIKTYLKYIVLLETHKLLIRQLFAFKTPKNRSDMYSFNSLCTLHIAYPSQGKG